jgi:hypothetical protein
VYETPSATSRLVFGSDDENTPVTGRTGSPDMGAPESASKFMTVRSNWQRSGM